MESYYYIMVGILFFLAISDLVVGVSNDAVNFLNSAIGSKAFSLRRILIVASLGVLFGAFASNGMMEIARKGIFVPSMFNFEEIMILFMSVMLTDVLLLDLFNTLRLPTSTTVSVVFELLGASVALALIRINNTDGLYLENLGQFINSAKALAIISGILVSVVIAFSVGAMVQYIARLVFTFHFEKKLPYFGALFGGVAITAIFYFIFIKGLKGTEFYGDIKHLIEGRTFLVLLYIFLFWTILCQILYSVFKVNILKLIIILGTFSLAMAFAGNDLVNFIGVPIAAFQAFQAWVVSGTAPADFSMAMLGEAVTTPTVFLLISGVVMAGTLWFSKKARKVTETEVNLARQGTSNERFNPNALSRGVVRVSVELSKLTNSLFPKTTLSKIENRFTPRNISIPAKDMKDEPAFDLIRASVNLMVAGILISLGTSLKLPLSTTYVTFMVAMGSSLADRAWDRESAVYRISGVFHVIGGWFMTALVAFTASAIIAYIIYLGQKFGGTAGTLFVIVVLTILALMALFHAIIFKKKKKEDAIDEAILAEEIDLTEDKTEFIEKSTRNVASIIKHISDVYSRTIEAFTKGNLKMMHKMDKKAKSIEEKARTNRNKVHAIIHDISTVSMDAGNYYVQVADYLREVGRSIKATVEPMTAYVANNHKLFNEEQAEELKELAEMISEIYNEVKELAVQTHHIEKEKVEMIEEKQQKILEYIAKLRKRQVRRIKNDMVGTRNTIMHLNILNETKNLLIHTKNVVKYLAFFLNTSNQAIQEDLDEEHIPDDLI